MMNRQNRSLAPLAALVVSLVLAAVGPVSAQSKCHELKYGKWKLRASPPASGTREYEDRGGGLFVSTRQGVDAKGQRYFSHYSAKYDGKDYPRAIPGSTGVQTIAFTVVDECTAAYTLKTDGKVTATGTTTVSKDGKVLTVTTKGINATQPGTPEVYDRQ